MPTQTLQFQGIDRHLPQLLRHPARIPVECGRQSADLDGSEPFWQPAWAVDDIGGQDVGWDVGDIVRRHTARGSPERVERRTDSAPAANTTLTVAKARLETAPTTRAPTVEPVDSRRGSLIMAEA